VRGASADFFKAHPTNAELMIDVAVSSATLDRENASIYAEAGVAEYWIVLGNEHQVEVYRRPENGRYLEMRRLGAAETREATAVPAFRIRVAGLIS
jgi:Uma2 family endonuclease